MTQTPEVLVPRLGDALVEQKILSISQLNEALRIQYEERAKGNNFLIGRILVDNGYISQETLNSAINNQVFQLHSALKQANATLEQRVKDRTAELEIAYEKLRELATLKANFISNISHELRTPLTHIKGYINLLIENDIEAFSPEQQYALKTIEKASERLNRLIEDLILFTTAETSSIQINNEKFNIIETIKSIVGFQQIQAQSKKISLLLDSPSENVFVFSDHQKVRWVINQLVDNALKFTSSGGKVTVKILHLDGSRVQISVIDTGLGIPASKLDEIFEPFHQLDESTTRQQGGVGLGLSLARKIVSALGSRIEVASSTDHGSTFSFVIH